jgi:hypothetical protein
MAKLITPAERIARARELIKNARALAVPPDPGWQDYSYVSRVKDLMRQAKDLLKLIPLNESVSPEQKLEAQEIIKEIEKVEKEILHRFVI